MYSGLWENRCFSCSIIKMWFFFDRLEGRNSSPGFDAAFPSVAFIHGDRLYFTWLSWGLAYSWCQGMYLPKMWEKNPKTQTPKLKAVITSEIILQITQWRSTRMVSIFKSHFILQLIQYVIGFRLALGSAGADLLWRLQEDSSGGYGRAVHTRWKSFSLQEQCLYVSSDIQFLC